MVWNEGLPLTPQQDNLPEGRFLFPLCTTRENFQLLINALHVARGYNDEPADFASFSHMIDVLEGMAHVGAPANSDCWPETDTCRLIYPSNAQITFSPNDPFTPGDPPPGYNTSPWYKGSQAILPGAQATDVYCDLLSSLPRSVWTLDDLIFQSGLPRFRVDFTGRQEVEIKFVTVPQGGLAMVVVDDNIFSIDIIDLSQLDIGDALGLDDLLGFLVDGVFDKTIFGEFIWEKVIEGEGAHHIDVTFLPNPEIALPVPAPIYAWGGGLRSVTFCGERSPMIEDVRVTGCTLEKKIGGVWVYGGDLSGCITASPAAREVGIVGTFLRNACPSGWLPLDGTTYNVADYPELVAVLDPSYIDGSEFTLPDFGDVLIRGALPGDVIGDVSGLDEIVVQIENLPPHKHRDLLMATAGKTADPGETDAAFPVATDLTVASTDLVGGGQPIPIKPRSGKLKLCVLASPEEVTGIVRGPIGPPGRAGADGRPGECDDCDTDDRVEAFPPPNPDDYPENEDLCCLMATGGLNWVRDTFTEIKNGFDNSLTPVLIATGIVLGVLVAASAPWSIPAIIGMLGAFFAFLNDAANDWFEDADWDQLLCIFYCNCGDNYYWSPDDWDVMLQEIRDLGTPLWGLVVTFLETAGRERFNNAAQRLIPPTADCSTCVCATPWREQFNAARLDSLWSVDQGTVETNHIEGIRRTGAEGEGYDYLVRIEFDRSVRLTRVELRYRASSDSPLTEQNLSFAYPFRLVAQRGNDGIGDRTLIWEGSELVDFISIYGNWSAPDSRLYEVIVDGVAYNPWEGL